jgi:sodium transport system ATP-binding protein
MIVVNGLAKHFKLTKNAHNEKSQGGVDVREVAGMFQAVRDVSFHCAPGEVFGLLGPNGAGKTTSLRMLSTALTPTAGTISVDGIDLIADPVAARRKFGYLSSSTGLYNRLSVCENLRYFGEVHGINSKALDARIAFLLECLEMGSYADRRAETLSTGMKQRALIARTVIHSPNVLILDEPTTGLDILGAQTVINFIRDCQQGGAAIIFSTHHLHEVEALCQRVGIINTGVSIFEGEVKSLVANGAGSLAAGYLATLGGNENNNGAGTGIINLAAGNT